MVLAYFLIQVDTWIGVEAVRDFGWLYTFGPEGARAILSAIASSMITVAGLTFSITMLTLQLASSQFGPRLLRNFMRDRGNQLVLGTFIGTFIYCLLVLRTVRGTEEAHFVPHIAVAFGVLLAIASIAVLIYFIHHVATSIRIETLLAQLAAETSGAIDQLYPERMGLDGLLSGNAAPETFIPADFELRVRAISCGQNGYVQRVDVDALMGLATEHELIVRIEARPGRFVKEEDAILVAYPQESLSDEMAGRLRGAFVVGQERTPEQDLEFSIRRIVEIAQRALSPGINDPTTALYCIDRLGETLSRLAERNIPSPMRFDEKQRLRVMTQVASLDDLACSAFAAVARYGIEDADVVAKLLSTMDMLAASAPLGAVRIVTELRDEIRRKSLEETKLNHDRKALLIAANGRPGRT
jgi:uncharacterized membrane protein